MKYNGNNLQEVLSEHEKWLRDKSGSSADFSGANLNGADLSYINLNGANFNENRFEECAEGMHFFINRQEAVEYKF